MNRTAARTRTARPPRAAAGVLVVLVALTVGVLGYLSTSSPAHSLGDVLHGDVLGGDVLPGDAGRATTQDDGVLPGGVTVFDDRYPGVSELDTELLGRVRAAATDAGGVGIEFHLNSGWRSPAYQDQLLREAIADYGSVAEAARWVATADTSPHVSGDAVDLGPADAAAWLSEHGAGYGLCQIYRNEPWHFELRPEAVGQGCPPPYADPTQDPRMRR